MVSYLLEIQLFNEKLNRYEDFTEKFADIYEAEIKREKIIENKPQGWSVSWNKIYPLVKCSCGEEIVCINFTNTCEKCEKDYNFAGVELAERSQWGEETGERWQDCY